VNNIKFYELIKAVVFDLGDTLVSQETGDLLPFAVEALDWLRGRYKLALITNVLSTTPREKIDSILRDAGLEGFFEVVVVSSE
jgi:FMN phosphatase YigB (HAD superfamily)